MSIENTLPSYLSLSQALTQQNIGMTAAELHGLLSGMLCGGSQDSGWLTLAHELTNDGMAFSHPLSQHVQAIYEATREALDEDGFGFQLMLPEDEQSSVFDRVDALSGWVNHFLLGLGVMQSNLGQVKGEVGEAIDDLREIAQLGYDETDNPEDLEQSLEEVCEYVRMAAMLCHTEFSMKPLPDVKEESKPTLH